MGRQLTAVAGALLALACVGWRYDAARTDAEDHAPEAATDASFLVIPPGDSSEVTLVLDPTIFSFESAADLDSWLSELRAFYMTLPVRTCVNVFFVQRGRIGAGPDMRPCFAFDHSPRAPQRHRARLSQSSDSIAARYRSLWTHMHTPSQRSRSQSCLLSTVARAGELLPDAPSRARFYLIILSDMLEECNEWRQLNLEAAAEQQRIPRIDVRGLADLSQASAVYVRIAYHSRVQAHTARTQLLQFWNSVFQQLGAPRYRVVPLLDGNLLRR